MADVIEFPASGLTEGDLEALRGEGYRRLLRGAAGHVTRGYTPSGLMWAAILDRPGGSPVHHFCRDKGVYYVLHVGADGQARLVDANRDFTEVLAHLPGRPPRLIP
jgi:hypothetical protein